MKILAVIPARGGSKGVPRKNVRLLAGKPLIAYTIEAALAARSLFHRVIASTDDQEIADVCLSFGAEVPFLRPESLAGDRVPMVPVLEHAIRFVEQQDQVELDWVCLLQPTDPFRTVHDLQEAIALAGDCECDSVISVTQVFAVHPIRMKRIENDRLLPYCLPEIEGTARQDLSPPAYLRNGAIYLTRRNVVIEKRSIWGESIQPYVMPEDRSVSIDSELDLAVAEVLMTERTARR